MDRKADHKPTATGNDLFADETSLEPTNESVQDPWKIIIADDEEEVHTITRIVLGDYKFKERPLAFLSAYSGEETLRLIKENRDTAIILLDVVMETDDAGLEVARRIREEQKNKFVRIILRTGQPGKAPENKVISTYDINDYKEKTELTSQKLFTAITASLRNYRDLRIIEQNRRGLEQIIHSSKNLFKRQELCRFSQGILTQMLSILHLDESSLYLQESAFTASQYQDDDFVILAATGKLKDLVGKPLKEAVQEDILADVNRALKAEKSFYVDDRFVGYFATLGGSRHLLYMQGYRNLTELDKNLVSIFVTNVAIAFENIDLNREIVETQKEVVITLGEVIETRSKETGNHVRRVAEFSYFLALKYGLDQTQAELLRIASPMHDVGKVGIPDAVLMKPGKLDPSEVEIIQRHTQIGHEILKNSKREIMKAAEIAASQHHERWDGKGYPSGRKAEETHIFGRITALTDVFDALLHKRVYKEAWDLQKVLNYIREEREKSFEPRLVDIFLENIDEILAINQKFPDEKRAGLETN
jgi:response regulator RpfG family c-di-GMP phosphodiesterase